MTSRPSSTTRCNATRRRRCSSPAGRGLDPDRCRRRLEPPPLCAWRAGFSLHAAATVAADDKQGRLRMLRYCARPAFSSQYLSLLPDGRVRYQLRRSAGPGSAEAITLEPTDFLRRLAATLPRPYQHRTVYHGLFAPAASRRFEISPAAGRARRGRPRCHARSGPSQPDARHYRLEPSHHRDAEAKATDEATTDEASVGADAEQQAIARFCAPPRRAPSGRIPWSELIAHTFPDALDCPKCGAALSVIAYITELAVVRKILAHLGLPDGSTELAPARLPAELGFDYQADFDQSCRADADDSEPIEPEVAARPGRGPPGHDAGL